MLLYPNALKGNQMAIPSRQKQRTLDKANTTTTTSNTAPSDYEKENTYQ